MPAAQETEPITATKNLSDKTTNKTVKKTLRQAQPKPLNTQADVTAYTLDLLFYLKSITVFGMLFILAFFISKETLYYANTADYFSYAAFRNMGVIIILMLGLLYAQAMSVGCWYKNLQFIFVPLPIALGITISFFHLDTAPLLLVESSILNLPTSKGMFSTYINEYTGLIFVISYAAVATYVFTAMRFKNQFVKFSPITVLRPASKGALLLFSAYAGFVVYTATNEGAGKIRPSELISGMVTRMVDRQVDRQLGNLEKSINDELSPLGKNSDGSFETTGTKEDSGGIAEKLKGLESKLGINLEDSISDLSGGFDFSQFSLDIGTLGLDKEQIKKDIQANINKQIDNTLSPYRKFLAPFAGLTAFFTFRFFLWFAYAIYMATVDILMWFLKKVGFFRIEHEMVERELVRF